MQPRPSTWVHPRRSTLVLMGLFAMTLVTYLMVRPPAPVVVTIAPDGTPMISTPRTSPSHEPKKQTTPRGTTVQPTSTPTTSLTTSPIPTTTTTTPSATPTPRGTPPTATTTPAPTTP
jgi:hypothetical protein